MFQGLLHNTCYIKRAIYVFRFFETVLIQPPEVEGTISQDFEQLNWTIMSSKTNFRNEIDT